MKAFKSKTLGVKFTKDFPSTEEEWKLAGLPTDKIMDIVIKHVAYHVFMGDVREQVAESFVKSTKVARKEVPTCQVKKNGDAIMRDEPAQEYVDRLLTSKEITQSDLTREVLKAVEATKVEATSPRQANKSDTQEALAAADILRGDVTRMDKFVNACEKYEVELPDGASREQVANAYLELREAKKREAQDEIGL